LIERHVAGKSTAGLFAVTFDDAYVSLATDEVREVLRGGRLPITIFVVTDASEKGSTFWWDRVETAQRIASREAWADFERAIDIPSSYRTAASAAYGPLRPLRQWVLEQHAGRWPLDAEDSLATLETRAGAPPPPRAMTFDELDALVRRDAVDIAVHTVSHPVLPLLDDDEVRAEIASSFATLTARWPATLPWLAAPFGLYDARTSRLAREVGLQGILNLHAYTLAQTSPTHGFPRVNITENAPAWKLGLRLSALSSLIWAPPQGVVPYPPRPAPD
jgi:peptidoglycan/xylan/chitin deacetylase (PgdA/CDA1 family)